MDFTLRCNSLKCRCPLADHAVVTTCSHIFCVPCSEALGLARAPAHSSSSAHARVCPACETDLGSLDDVLVTRLNPAEDYKTSVLSGLSPTIVMECAGRALAFFSYQTAQEILYQEFLARSLTDRYATLSSQMDKVIHDANSEITSLRDKLEATHLDQKALEQKNHDLAEKYKGKSKQQQQLLRQYQLLKRGQETPGLEMAADQNAENFLRAAAAPGSLRRGSQYTHSRGSNGSGSGGEHSRTIQAWEQQSAGSRVGMQTSRSAPGASVPATPSGHRQHFPMFYGNSNGTVGKPSVAGGDANHHGSAYRPLPLQNMEPNLYGNGASYGMSAGMKMGRQPSDPIAGRAGAALPFSRNTGLNGVRGR
ncbi:hypothetical protein LTR91_006094 [Friedmanniomyces endolithicus]|uniref:RING-type domain-containing protein n=1 Tax=Friedmanniomyces endolithicus TaxID=329885 RepID=A0AAN6QXB8_9PEZI|nr:hypothetical protein LTR35_009865 [Friedmanniomyces endolithicus]KAK0283195.1 hypothetical protein LTS00_011799 [Friedmanniomyces endolithicus]KAK0320049.1 hypothetical protein LTR82_008984 [Friedmanniomyces endolithicus]KAK0923815.1 hypothetical protein LTR57_006475 [Friedmanniomyces endolithicus]KAK0995629.1 hypothetical protein LTR54_010445 [Friedmanniomyces endolithicus]